HPQSRALVVLRVAIKVVERPVKLVQLRPFKGIVGRGVILTVREQEVTGCEKRFCSRHRPLLSIQRRPALCVPGRGWVASSDHRHIQLRSTHLLHLPTHTYRAIGLIDCDICPAYQSPSHNWPRELPTVC